MRGRRLIRLTTLVSGDRVFDLTKIKTPFTVPLGTLHPSLRMEKAEVSEHFQDTKIGTAVRLWHTHRRVVYLASRRGWWSMDARRDPQQRNALVIVGFADMGDVPGFPV